MNHLQYGTFETMMLNTKHRMQEPIVLLCLAVLWTSAAATAQTLLTWDQVRERFEKDNPTLLAGEINVDESRAQEITAYLRPNPQFAVSTDGTQIVPNSGSPWTPLVGNTQVFNVSYLHEREHKRELRLESAQQGTAVAVSTQSDLKRNLIFNLRSAFVSVLQAKAVVKLAKDNLAYFDHLLDISRLRAKDGAMAQIDLERLELQRVQYESDLETADVNLRTSKITLLMLLNDRTPIEKFDVTGPFDFADQLRPIQDLRQEALDTRPDLRAAVRSLEQARTNYKLAVANGSTDPTFALWWSNNPSFNFSPGSVFGRETLGGSISVPLRVFDRNQGEKQRTLLDIKRNQKLVDAAEAQVLNDVDSSYATLESTVNLLRPYKARYLQMSTHVRDTVLYSYQRGGASLLDFLNAESDYRTVQRAYVNLVGSYLVAAAQLNMAVGKEIIQ
jgi:cobalt-zinc-cadmium efflux system outer membrane protein